MITFEILLKLHIVSSTFPVFVTLLKGFSWEVLDYPRHSALNVSKTYLHKLR